MSRKKNIVPGIMLMVSVVGFSMFYLVPFFISFSYALMENPINRDFAGLKNFVELFQNPYFLRGLKNTLLFMGVSIPLNILLALGLAVIISHMGRFRNLCTLLILIPLVVPSATTAFFWGNVFGRYGIFNQFLTKFGLEGEDWFQSKYGMIAMIVIFLWKNIGYNMILFLSGLAGIPRQYYECAEMEGAGSGWKFTRITLRSLTPTFFLLLIYTIVNSFKVFKEIYMITGEYPHESLYVLQHYMNNMFLSLNYPKLVTAVYILTAGIVLLLAGLFRIERKVSDNLRE